MVFNLLTENYNRVYWGILVSSLIRRSNDVDGTINQTKQVFRCGNGYNEPFDVPDPALWTAENIEIEVTRMSELKSSFISDVIESGDKDKARSLRSKIRANQHRQRIQTQK